jgi:hypothetical protein
MKKVNKPSIQITTHKFVINGETIPMNKIKGARCVRNEQGSMLPFILLIAGLVSLLFQLFVGSIIVLLALAWLFQFKPQYVLVVEMTKGERQVYRSANEEEVIDLADRLNHNLYIQKTNYNFLAI